METLSHCLITNWLKRDPGVSMAILLEAGAAGAVAQMVAGWLSAGWSSVGQLLAPGGWRLAPRWRFRPGAC